MDFLLANIESKTYALSVPDESFSYVNIRHVNFYANTDAACSFMPSDKLEAAFYKTLTQFPLLVGDLTQRSDRHLEIVVNKDDLNMPGYRESQSEVDFRDIKSAQYNQKTWPSDLETVGKVPCPDANSARIKLADIHVVRMKNNTGLIISTAFVHATTDGYGCFEFLNRWAEETRALITGEPARHWVFCFDRSAIRSHLPAERAPISDMTRNTYTDKSWFADFLTWLSPISRGKLMSYLAGHGSYGRMPELRYHLLEHVPYGTRISDNDLLSASSDGEPGWLARTISRAMGIRNEHCLGIPCDIRHRLDMTDINYIGNPMYHVYFSKPIDYAGTPTTPTSLGDIAAMVRKIVSEATPPRIGTLYDVLETEDISLGNFSANLMSFKMVTGISNQIRFKFYEADFGSGVQSFATVMPDFGEGTVIFLPSPPPSRDILVNLTVSPQVKECILKDRFWMQLAEFVY
ncbi:hypothetical protein DL89DRAFT_324979 [Linderina pennispora]|uniref:Transferase-domain-containing protein n=1 Tax=Linderina pennispora TaxID=61395 RepID=A0A1Y1VZ93_9FUNG|nr:uncharacterized protein DL89DRAFT_324979 [Linderina pennispora]ORX66579.1 hypothetical protein DL89DRAFT_324979 [Linderina pennispora]